MWGRVKGHTRAGGAPEPLGKSRSAGTALGTRHKGYLADVAAQGGHHAPGVPLHALHQPVVPRAARGVQRGRALRGQRRLSPAGTAPHRGLAVLKGFWVRPCPELTWNSGTPVPIWLTLGKEPL